MSVETVRVALRVPSAATNVARTRWNGACLRKANSVIRSSSENTRNFGACLRARELDRQLLVWRGNWRNHRCGRGLQFGFS